MLKLNMMNTLAFAGVVLFIGYRLRRVVPVLSRYNIPAPVVGGLLVATLITLMRAQGVSVVEFDTTLQSPLMVAFFTSVGYGASFALLRVGGPQLFLFFGIASLFALLQSLVGVLVALPLGVPPLLGVIAGTLTLSGGPATGLAFAPQFEAAGIQGAASLAIAAAMVGIVAGGILGGPGATRLINRLGLKGAASGDLVPHDALHAAESLLQQTSPPAAGTKEDYSLALLTNISLILVAMWAGSWLSSWITSMNITLPPYIGAMLVAAAIRNFADTSGWLGISQRGMDELGNVALSFFIAMALMTLKLWEVAALALPLIVILAVQIVVLMISLPVVFRVMGRDYEAAVMTGGFVGFMLGTTANAIANMRALVESFGLAPRAFLVVPIVGAFFIDFSNALIITVMLNILG
jgi:ESS family glutamate:Na+ symporter